LNNSVVLWDIRTF